MISTVDIGLIADALSDTLKCITQEVRIKKVKAIRINSRCINKDEAFVAIRGPKNDGHDYVAEAISLGACLVIVDHVLPVSCPQVIVKDTFKALGQIGELNRNFFSGKVFGVTGSCGKTSVKEMIAGILAQEAKVLSTTGNLNNGYGVPLMLAQLEDGHKYGVIEMGTSSPGEIAYITGLTRPNIAMITNASESHLTDLKNVDGVAREKGTILNSLSYTDSAILNFDDKFYDYWCQGIRERKQKCSILSFSQADKKADCYAKNIQIGANGMTFTLHLHEEFQEVRLQFWGVHQVRNACCAALAASSVGISMDKIVSGLESVKPFDKRGQRYQAENGVVLFDESYNANPCSVRAAIDFLADYKHPHTLILGDMLELGAHSDELHCKIGEYAKKKGIDNVLSYGKSTRYTAQTFGHGIHFDDKLALIQWVKANLKVGEVILVKGSRGMGMEKVVQSLISTKCKEGVS